MSLLRLAHDYWLYLKLVAASIRTRGLLAASFALLAFIAILLGVAAEPDKPGSWASLFTLLSAIFAALTVIRMSMKANFDENYSLAFALAHGYVSNFARQAIDDLKTLSPDGTFVVFRPEGLAQLEEGAVKGFKQKIVERGYRSSVRHLEGEGKRVRDVLVVESLEGGTQARLRYVDFPSTLLTLKSLVDYRSAERKRKSEIALSSDEQEIITRNLINMFFDELVKLLATDITAGRVRFTDSSMVHL